MVISKIGHRTQCTYLDLVVAMQRGEMMDLWNGSARVFSVYIKSISPESGTQNIKNWNVSVVNLGKIPAQTLSAYVQAL